MSRKFYYRMRVTTPDNKTEYHLLTSVRSDSGAHKVGSDFVKLETLPVGTVVSVTKFERDPVSDKLVKLVYRTTVSHKKD